MKKIYALLSIMLLCFAVNISKAQTDQSAPTKDDAVTFINKVIHDYPGSYIIKAEDDLPQINGIYLNGSVSLDGCMLTLQIETYSTYEDKSSSLTRKYVINLALVYLSGNKLILSNQNDAITAQSWGTGFGGDVKLAKAPLSIEQLNFRQMIMSDEKASAVFKDRNYGARIMKALDFLIKQCGGGKMKVDVTEKF